MTSGTDDLGQCSRVGYHIPRQRQRDVLVVSENEANEKKCEILLHTQTVVADRTVVRTLGAFGHLSREPNG